MLSLPISLPQSTSSSSLPLRLVLEASTTNRLSQSLELISCFPMVPPTPFGLMPAKLKSLSRVEGRGASGVCKGTGAKFGGSPDLCRYNVEFNSPDAGISGIFEMKSLAPAQYVLYPTSPSVAGISQAIPAERLKLGK